MGKFGKQSHILSSNLVFSNINPNFKVETSFLFRGVQTKVPWVQCKPSSDTARRISNKGKSKNYTNI